MGRRDIVVAVIFIGVVFVVRGQTSGFQVDWAWFSAIGYRDVFGTILGGKAVLFFAVFAGSAILLWVNGSLASRFARRRGHVPDVGSPFWPEPFRAIYTRTFAQTLSLALAVQNPATRPITFAE